MLPSIPKQYISHFSVGFCFRIGLISKRITSYCLLKRDIEYAAILNRQFTEIQCISGNKNSMIYSVEKGCYSSFTSYSIWCQGILISERVVISTVRFKMLTLDSTSWSVKGCSVTRWLYIDIIFMILFCFIFI